MPAPVRIRWEVADDFLASRLNQTFGGNSVTIARDSVGRVSTITDDVTGVVVTFTRDTSGKVSSWSDGTNTWTLTRNSAGNVTDIDVT